MKTARSRLLPLFCFLSALAGGLISQGLAGAKSEPPVQRLVRAQEVQIVDARGTKRAAIGLEPGGDLAIFLYDKQGRVVGVQAITPESVASIDKAMRTLQSLDRIIINPGR